MEIKYERLRDVPSLVKTLCFDHSGIIVGGAALFLVDYRERVHDWDVIVPVSAWVGVSRILPYQCRTNTFGGVKIADPAFVVDVWVDDVASYFATMNPNYAAVAVNIRTQQVITATRRGP